MTREAFCLTCGVKFELPVQRGRPPTKCETCRKAPQVTKVKEKLTAVEIVDRLEENLKRSGRHISQQKDWNN